MLSSSAPSIAAMAGAVAGEEEKPPRGKRKRGGGEAADLAPAAVRFGLRERKLGEIEGDPGRGKRGAAGKRRREVGAEENGDGQAEKVGYSLVFVRGFCCLVVCWR